MHVDGSRSLCSCMEALVATCSSSVLANNVHHRHAAACSSSSIRKSRIVSAEFGKCSDVFLHDSEAFSDDKLSIGLVNRLSEEDSLDDDSLDVDGDDVHDVIEVVGGIFLWLSFEIMTVLSVMTLNAAQ